MRYLIPFVDFLAFTLKSAVALVAIVTGFYLTIARHEPGNQFVHFFNLNTSEQHTQVAHAPPQKKPDTTDQDNAEVNAGNTPALSGLIVKGAVVHRHFPVGEQLTAWDISFGGHRDIYYTTASGQYLLLGAVLNAQGKNISAKHQATLNNGSNRPTTQQASGPSQEKLKSIYAKLQKTKTITVANGTPEFYVIYEPHCPFCARLHKQLVKMNVTAHYVPVAFLSPRSKETAAILLDADHPRKLLNSLTKISMTESPMRDWIKAHKPDHKLPSVDDELQANARLMHAAGITGTPALLYKDTNGKVHLRKGLPPQSTLDRYAKAAQGSGKDG